MSNSVLKIRVGSRGSMLALAQVEEIKKALHQLGRPIEFELQIYDTQGDLDRTTPLTDELPDDFFTNTLDQALLNGEIDIAIHSAKDLPKKLPDGLALLALTASIDETDAFIGKTALSKLKRGARVGTSSPLRRQMVKQLNPRVTPVPIRGTIESRLRQLDEGKYDGVIVATCALKRLGLKRRIKEIMPWEPTPLQGQLAVVGRAQARKWERLFGALDVRQRYGEVTLIGAGPGDPGLITVKATELLAQAQVVFYDFLINKDLLRYAPCARKVYVGKRKGEHSLAQSVLNNMMRQEAMKGKRVVRLKGGDPLIFGRGADEIAYLRAYHIPVRVVPGVSSATAIPTELSIPLTARGIADSVAFVSGHSENDKKGSSPICIPDVKTVVLLMGLSRLKEIVTAFQRKQWPPQTPVIVASRGTMRDERIVVSDLKHVMTKVRQASLKPPALIIVGETARFYDERFHREKTVLYTGTHPDQYKKYGQLIHIPMIRLKPVMLTKARRRDMLKMLPRTDIVLITSPHGVECFFKLLDDLKFDSSTLKGKKFVVIGRTTAAALRQHKFSPALVAQEESSVGLFKEMKRSFDLKGARILFPRSALPNPILKRLLTQAGARVKEVAVYTNTKPLKRQIPRGSIDEVIFTSPSTVENFLKDHGSIPGEWKIRSKGPLTAKALLAKGFKSEKL